MSHINGDKARSHRARSKRIKQRMKNRDLRAKLAGKPSPPAAKAGKS